MSAPAGVLAGIVAVVWGLCFVLIQASLPSAAPLLLAGLRATIGGGVLSSWIMLTRWRAREDRARTRSVGSGSWRSGLPSLSVLIILALTNAALAFGTMCLAAGRAEAAVASILGGGQPVVLAVAGWAFFGERASVRTIVGLTVAMAGVVLLATTSSGATSPDGVALSLLATAAPAAGTVMVRRIGSSIDVLTTTSVQFVLGGVMLLVVSVLLEPWAGVGWTPEAVVGLLVLGVLGTGVAYVAWFWLLGRTSLIELGTALFLIPVVGVTAGIFTGDRPAPVELAGIAALLVGIGLITVGRSSRTPVKTMERT